MDICVFLPFLKKKKISVASFLLRRGDSCKVEGTLKDKNFFLREEIFTFTPIALRTAKTLWSFGHFECSRFREAPSEMGFTSSGNK